MPDQQQMGPGEIARSLTRLERGMEQLAATIKNLNVVSRDEYLAHRQGDDTRLVAIETDVRDLERGIERVEKSLTTIGRRQEDARKWMIGTFIGPVLTGVVIVALLNALAL